MAKPLGLSMGTQTSGCWPPLNNLYNYDINGEDDTHNNH